MAATAVVITGETGAADVVVRRLPALALLVAATAVGAPAGPDVEVKISRSGFEPPRIVLRRGETTRLLVSSSAGEHCFAVDALRIEKRVTAGKPTRLELTPERAGSFVFYCCLESGAQADRERGELIVSE